MKQQVDIISDAITNSAKTRFDYAEFKEMFSDLDNDNVPETILIRIIAGYVEGKPPEQIAGEIENEFLALGCIFLDGDFQDFIANKAVELAREIYATKIALDLLKQEMPIPDVLVMVKSIAGI
jgi:hypothetical protein